MRVLYIMTIISILLTSSVYAACSENWQCSEWGKCFDGFTERSCFDYNACGTTEQKPIERTFCESVYPQCADGLLNNDETDIDCGGKSCSQCDIGKNCFRDSDCKINLCHKNMCGTGESPAAGDRAAPIKEDYWLVFVISVFVIGLILIIHAVSKRQKAPKILIIKDSRQELKEELSRIIYIKKIEKSKNKVIAGKDIAKMNERKKSDNSDTARTKNAKENKGLKRFMANLDDTFKPIKNKKAAAFELKKEKDLLNKFSYKNRSLSERQAILNSIKEAYYG